ncbi:MAG: glycosyltransferase [Eubacteriales bacterium]|nr:glycosyltransferase [Eubacteriales bacterium]
MPEISIAMTTYNGERYIKTQLQSIFNQTRQADEVVIFDDCSTDRTADVVEAFIKENGLNNWTFKVNSRNIGFIENFYQAVLHTTGDIIFLCDQDDVWHHDKVERMEHLFYTHKDIKVLNTGFREINEEGEEVPLKTRFNRSNHNLIRGNIRRGSLKKFGFDDIIWRNISPGCTAAFVKECRALFVDHYSKLCPHDWELNIYGAILNGLYFYNEELIDYRIHSDNTIGLIKLSMASRFSMNADLDKRTVRAENEYERAGAFISASWQKYLDPTQKKVLQKYRRLTGMRCRILSTRKIGCWISALWHISDYIKLMGPQGIVDDFKYVLKHGK